MAILIVGKHRTLDEWKNAFAEFDSGISIYHFEEEYPKEEITYAISWNHPEGYFNRLTNLQVIASLGAGVDHILKDTSIPDYIKITRIVDDKLTTDMADFVLLCCLNYTRNTHLYFKQQQYAKWKQYSYSSPNQLQVGVLGYGELGKTASQKLVSNGFKVRALANSSKENAPIPVYAKDELTDFMQDLDILVCLLPLTEQTKGFLNRNLFQQANKAFYLVNVARGAHLVEYDLLDALQNKQILGAHLDVFTEEPLPEKHPFWSHPNISISPHVASQTSPASVTQQLYENYVRMHKNQELINLVDRNKAY